MQDPEHTHAAHDHAPHRDRAHAHAAGHHGHDHARGASAHRLRWALAVLLIFTVIEAVGGWWVNSLALLSDAVHMAADSAALLLALVAIRLSARPPSARLTYGNGRWQTLAAFVNGLVLLLLTVGLIVEALQRLWRPEAVEGGWMLVIAALGGLANLGALFALTGGESLNERGARLHVLSDLLGSAAAMLAAGLILGFNWTVADPLLSLLVSALILRSGWHLTRDSAHVLLEGAPASLSASEVREALADVPGVAGAHHVHVWSLDGAEPVVTLHVRLAAQAESEATLRAVHHRLHDALGIEHATVQIEAGACIGPGQSHCHLG
ncbi:MAG: cation diffusion facilitator family transporter [Thiomonas sp. SCN 64-16]|uniref:cation diffusion facilitator family transporter n=1 Tax=Thiomonas sp. SCN 64-16 TaxID=1660151 RepID=UPI00086D0107|nr:cation diffusion facilitator family transporter [Thiomonas sp. SCN 64-16]ODU95793.1 MAG: cation diffusion facilitator family transporter [Thiomonas sp. SCN 64-16]